MNKFIGLAVGAVLFLNVGTVFADDSVTIEVNNSNVTVSGTNAMPDGKVTLQVYLGENTADTLETLTPEKYMDIIVCHDQTTANENGEYTFSFDIENKTNDYTAFIKKEGSSEVIDKTFPFVNMKQFENVVNNINYSSSDTVTMGYLVDNKEVFGLTLEKIEAIDIKALSKIIYNYISGGKQLSNSDRTDTLKIIDYAYFVQQLNENKISNIYDNSQVNGLAESSISEWYNKEFVTRTLEKDFTDRLSGKAFAKLEQYENELMGAFMLAVVENPNGYANIVSVASAFATHLGIPVNYITNANCQRIAGNNYSTVAEFINDLKPQIVVGTSPSGGGGAPSGRGGASSKPVMSIDTSLVENTSDKLNINIFDDLSGYEWAETAIVKLAEHGVVNGKEKYKFYPADFITREEFVKMLVKALEIPSSNAEISFSDADKDAWYYESLQTAVASGIVKGKGDGTFGIGEKISRQDMAYMAYNALIFAKKDFDENSNETFADDYTIADYAKASVYALRSRGIINGIGDNLYNPLAYSDRASAAKVIYMIMTL